MNPKEQKSYNHMTKRIPSQSLYEYETRPPFISSKYLTVRATGKNDDVFPWLDWNSSNELSSYYSSITANQTVNPVTIPDTSSVPIPTTTPYLFPGSTPNPNTPPRFAPNALPNRPVTAPNTMPGSSMTSPSVIDTDTATPSSVPGNQSNGSSLPVNLTTPPSDFRTPSTAPIATPRTYTTPAPNAIPNTTLPTTPIATPSTPPSTPIATPSTPPTTPIATPSTPLTTPIATPSTPPSTPIATPSTPPTTPIATPSTPPTTQPYAPINGNTDSVQINSSNTNLRENHCALRILNASTFDLPLNVAIDDEYFVKNSVFSDVSPTRNVEDGFHHVIITNANGKQNTLFDKYLPFPARNLITLVIIERSNKLDIIEVYSNPCNLKSSSLGCMRIANMSHENSFYDVFLSTGELAFHDIRFKELTNYKQISVNEYEFYIANTLFGVKAAEVPVINCNTYRSFSNANEPLISFTKKIQSKNSYTTFIIGNPWSSTSLRAIFLEDTLPL